MVKLLSVIEYDWKEKVIGKSKFEKGNTLLINPEHINIIEPAWDNMFKVTLGTITSTSFYITKQELELIKINIGW